MRHTFQGRTINEVVFEALKTLITKGERTSSRNGDVVALYNVFFTIEHPRSRHLNLVGRKNNIFAMIAETMWILAGDNTLDPFLTFFLPRAHDFSDDDKTWRGGYGPRLYQYGQLENAIISFEREGIQSRKSVISIYLPEFDSAEGLQKHFNLEKTKDLPCNNMIHFFITPNKQLHMTVFQRSGDVIWGMGSINIFEWTFLQEFVLGEIQQRVDPDITLGTYNHAVTNLHMYDFTSAQGYDVVKAEYEQTMNRINTNPLLFPKGVEKNKQFFADLISCFNTAITQTQTDFKALSQSLHGLFETYYTHVDTQGLMYAYAMIVGAYICAKNGNKEITIDIRHLNDEFVRSIRDSKFRKFNLAETPEEKTC